MSLRFRRTMKIAPGVRLNLTKTGISARVGPKGAGVTVGTSGTTVSSGIPGSGLHVSKKLKNNTVQSNTDPFIPNTETKRKGLGAVTWLIISILTLGFLVIIS